MTSGLLHDNKILASLGHNLVSLDLMTYCDSVELANIDLDCFSSMQNLRHLQIYSFQTRNVWRTEGLLSSLTALESFTFHGDSHNLHGPFVSALRMLPKLTQLTMSWPPGSNIELCSTKFSVLEGLHITSDAYDDVPSNVSLSIGQPFVPLRNLSMKDCYVSSAPILFAALPHLTKVEFERCSFAFDSWVLNAFEGATQVEVLKLDNTIHGVLPSSICQMRGVKQLSLQFSALLDLPAEFAHLTNLEDLDLCENDFSSVPKVLEQMTHLQTLSMLFCDFTQLTSPLTFFSAFANLRRLNLPEAKPSWNQSSMFYIGETQAALKQAFRHRPPSEKPEVLLYDYSFRV